MLKKKSSKSRCACISLLAACLFFVPAVYAENSDGMPGSFTLGDTDKDYVYSPVKPCRIVDTRNAGGPIIGGTSRAFVVRGGFAEMVAQGGNPDGCFAPRGEPRAVHINIAVDKPLDNGYLTAWPTGTSMPKAAVLNYRPTYSDPISNAVTVVTGYGLGAAKDINIYAKRTTHVIIDVMGYYYDIDSVFIDEDFVTGWEDNPSADIQFLAPPAEVTLTRDGQKIHVVSHKALGAGTDPAAGLRLWICYQSGGLGLNTVGGGSYGMEVPANTRIPMGLSAIIEGLPPDTYQVGLCGTDDGDGNWTNNEYGYTSAFVFQDND